MYKNNLKISRKHTHTRTDDDQCCEEVLKYFKYSNTV